MFTRAYPDLSSSMLILGARGVGKSTFVRQQLKPDLEIDLLHTQTRRALLLNPSSLEERVAHLKSGQTVFIDEVQKIPELLDEVHRLIESRKLKFILTGSSARKLRKNGTNLLAGRTLGMKMYHLCLHEVRDFDLQKFLKFGGLPALHATQIDPREYLSSYVEHYLSEEIAQEGAVRGLNEFYQFISLAGRYHGQIINYESLGREIGKSGDTIKTWFQLLEDTLLGFRIPSYSPGVFSRENKHPKFYFFDSGVAWAATGQHFDQIPTEYKGLQMEALLLNELKAYLECRRKKMEILTLSVPQRGDVDFILRVRKKSIGAPEKLISLEVKASSRWPQGAEKMSARLREKLGSRIHRAIAVYLGPDRLTKSSVEIFPLPDFIRELWSDRLVV